MAKKTPPKSVTIVVPLYNEEAALPVFIDAMDAELKKIIEHSKQGLKFSILFVNDGSTDATEFLARQARPENFTVQLINLTRNFGKENALYAGLTHAKGDAVVPMDVDLQDPPKVLAQMIECWLSGAKIVNARRVSRNEDTFLKRISAIGFYKLFNLVSERSIPENVGDFRLMDRDVVDAVLQIKEKKRFNKEIFAWVGFTSEDVTFNRPERSAGIGKWSTWKLWNLALDGIFSASTVPLRVWSYIGFFFAVLSLCYGLIILLYTFVVGREVPGYSSTVLLILFFGGLNLVSLGVLGEYIGRIYLEVRDRPAFIIHSTYALDD